jgi:hypothetical protein
VPLRLLTLRVADTVYARVHPATMPLMFVWGAIAGGMLFTHGVKWGLARTWPSIFGKPRHRKGRRR